MHKRHVNSHRAGVTGVQDEDICGARAIPWEVSFYPDNMTPCKKLLGKGISKPIVSRVEATGGARQSVIPKAVERGGAASTAALLLEGNAAPVPEQRLKF